VYSTYATPEIVPNNLYQTTEKKRQTNNTVPQIQQVYTDRKFQFALGSSDNDIFVVAWTLEFALTR